MFILIHYFVGIAGMTDAEMYADNQWIAPVPDELSAFNARTPSNRP